MSSNEPQRPVASEPAQPAQPTQPRYAPPQVQQPALQTAPGQQPAPHEHAAPGQQSAQNAQTTHYAQAAQTTPGQQSAQYAQPAPGSHSGYGVQSPGRGPGERLSHAPGSLNVPGIAALVVLLVNALMPMLTPSLFRWAASTDAIQLASTLISVVNMALLLIAGALAVVGLVLKRLTRWRWAAIGAAVSVGLGLVSLALSLFGGLLAQYTSSY